MTVYAAKGRNTGVAVVVFPGGGYRFLAMDLEGTEICDWLTSRGITCVLLKYRVPGSGPWWDTENKRRVYPKVQTALQDAQRTLGLVRQHAAQWHVDPHKVGVIGFSAGGHLVAAISTHFAQRTYAPLDGADKLSCRPDFAIAAYPGHLWVHEDEERATRDETDLGLRPKRVTDSAAVGGPDRPSTCSRSPLPRRSLLCRPPPRTGPVRCSRRFLSACSVRR
jgi:acetyl esterase/lipase